VRPSHGDPRARAGRPLFDADSTTEIGARLGPTDLLKFKDQKKYSERIKIAQKNTGEYDALIAMPASGPCAGGIVLRLRLHGRLDGLGGRRALRAGAETAVEIGAPYVCFSQSGGAACRKACSR
jgi:acetyl-CoA carboxylase carboxyl transferase subunit beta